MSVIQVVGLGFGDEGKGTTVDYLTRRHNARWNVRFNGSCQAAHNVVDGKKHHTFAQFGSGALAGAHTFLSRFVTINPLNLQAEADHLAPLIEADPYDRLVVHHRCRVVTQVHQLANLIRETARGKNGHGSTGQGVGEEVASHLSNPDLDICVTDLLSKSILASKLCDQAYWKWNQLKNEGLLDNPNCDELVRQLTVLAGSDIACASLATRMFEAGNKIRIDWYDDCLKIILEMHETVVFEGAQGVLLDENYGFHPYTTWSNTTFDNADILLKEAGYQGDTKRLGVIRSYLTRHGPGPFPSQDSKVRFKEHHNETGKWMGSFRQGHFDKVLLRYAVEACGGVDGLAVTHMDHYREDRAPVAGYMDGNRVVTHLRLSAEPDLAYQQSLTDLLLRVRPLRLEPSRSTAEFFLRGLQKRAHVPVVLTSWGPEWTDKIERTELNGEP